MQNKTLIFDSLAHPCINGDYLARNIDCSFEHLAKSMSQSAIKWCCAIGLEGVGGYSHENFAAACKQYPQMIPVAAVNPLNYSSNSEIATAINYLKSLGFKAIKLHPRISKFKVSADEVDRLFATCSQQNMPVFLCTYHYGSIDCQPQFEVLTELIKKHPDLKLLLVHSGAVELLKYVELARAYPNIVLDLSMTLMKYEGSSIDLDLEFAFQKFDRRICIGTDYPEYSLEAVSKRFEYFAKDISQEKKENIAYKNLANFLGITIN